MIVSCPSCKSKYKVDESKVPDQGLKLKCPKCTTAFKVLKPKPQATAAPSPAPVAPPPAQVPPAQRPAPPAPKPAPPAPKPAPKPAPPAPKPAPPAPKPAAKPIAAGPYKPQAASLGTVVIGDSDDVFLKQLARKLLQAGYTLYLAQDGETAMELIKTKLPAVAIVDVALPKIFGFDIAEQVKKDPALGGKIKIILLGSVHEKDRYRREPESYYGADEYIEKHHNGKEIAEKVRMLMSGEIPAKPQAPAPAPPAPPVAPAAPAPAPAPQAAPAPAPPAASSEPPPVPEDRAHQKAARLARTIVSDIVLYNPELVDRGIKEGNLYDLLAKDIQDGIKHYNNRVPESVRAVRNYYREAFDALVARKKAELGV